VASTLILYMGNPIVKNDQVGLVVGSRVASSYSARPDVEVRQFSGSPLDLVSDIQGYDRLILIDSISTGRRQVGSVTLFGEKEILAGSGDVYLHGMNLSEALKLCRRMQLPFPEKLHLLGIEAGVIYEFADTLSPELEEALPGIIANVHGAIDSLLADRA